MGEAKMQEKGDRIQEKWKRERKLDHLVMQLNNVQKRMHLQFFH